MLKQEIIVITGPVYAPIYVNNEWILVNRTIGTFPRLVHVPTHFFKVVICRRRLNSGGAVSAIAKGDNRTIKNTNNEPANTAANTATTAVWWPDAELSDSKGQIVTVGAFMVPNSDAVDSKVRVKIGT